MFIAVLGIEILITETIALVRLKCFLIGGRCMTWVLVSRGRQVFRGSCTGRARWLTTGRYGCVRTLDALRDHLPRDAHLTGSNRGLCMHRAKFVRRFRSNVRTFIIQCSNVHLSTNLSFLPSFIVFLRREPHPGMEGGGGFRPDRPGGSRMTN